MRTFVQRRLCPHPVRGVCGPELSARRTACPWSSRISARHNCLNPSSLALARILRGHLSPRRRGWIQGNLNLDNADALHRVALLGHGIVCLPTFIAGEDLRAGRLVRVLPKHLALEVKRVRYLPT